MKRRMEGAECGEVREQHRFDEGALERYLGARLPGFPSQGAPSSLAVRQYRLGHTNPTFHLQKEQKEYVLRKKPPGLLPVGSHLIDREYTVQKALFSIGFPVPEPLLYCEDASVIGTEFYVMEYVQGRIFSDYSVRGVTPAERRALFVAATETLARLHSLNIEQLDLKGYGAAEGFCKRQAFYWKEYYKSVRQTDIEAMNELSGWLIDNVPSRGEENRLIHGDFRIPNLIFHPKEARVVAVIDWELSTNGCPLADLAFFCLPYAWPAELKRVCESSRRSLHDVEGAPTFEELISIYFQGRGRPRALDGWNFFRSLAFFKVAAMSQGIYSRSVHGNASAAEAHKFGEMVKPVAEYGLRLTKESEATCGTG